MGVVIWSNLARFGPEESFTYSLVQVNLLMNRMKNRLAFKSFLKRKLPHYSSLGILIGMASAFLNFVLGLGTSMAQPVTDLNSMTVDAFLLNAPFISRAVFEKEDLNVASDVPRDQLKHRFLVKCDNTNYFIATLNGNDSAVNMTSANGDFNGVFWSYFNKDLIFHDPTINTHSDGQEAASRFNVNLLANLGFPAISRTYRALDQSNQCILSRWNDGTKVAIRLKYDKGIIQSATLSDAATGEEITFVSYRYSANFLSGKFPFEFTQAFMTQPGGGFKETCVIRIIELAITNQPLTSAEVNPEAAFVVAKGAKHFHSNDVAYAVGSKGKVWKIPTGAEAQEKIQRKFAQTHKGITPFRVLLLFFVAAPGILLVGYFVKSLQNKNKKP